MKKIKTSRVQAHTSKSPKGSGDFYGTGIKQPVGKVRRDYLNNTSLPSNVKKPPRSLA